MKKTLRILLFLILCLFVQTQNLLYAQQYPVRVTPVVLAPYSLKLSDYATTTQQKLQVQILMTDLMQPAHQTGLKFSLEAGLNAQPFARSNDFVVGLPPFNLYPGTPVTLSNIDLRPLFELQNLNGISALQYSKALPEGAYQFCFQAFDFYTKNNLSAKSCATVYLTQYDPPQLSLPQRAEKIQANNNTPIIFQWLPRQVAPNTQYTFILKELWDLGQSPKAGFLASRTLWQETSFAPMVYYGLDKPQLIPGKRYAWQVQAKSGAMFDTAPNNDNGVYKNNGLSEIFYFDYVENCPTPTFLMAKNVGRARVELSWSSTGQNNGLYRIQYRKKNSQTQWQTAESYQTRYTITGLEDHTEYEYRIGSVCGWGATEDNYYHDTNEGNAYAFSGIQYFTTDSKDAQNTNYQCGVMPNIEISNKNLLQSVLGTNETFTAGDFPVTIIDAQGSNGSYSGTGYIQVPYLADTKIKVVFNNIQLNTDRQLISGVVETSYDIEEANVVEVSIGDLINEIVNLINKDTITDEDKARWEALKKQWDFYSSNVDDMDMSDEDKDLFRRIQGSLFIASIGDMSEKEKENAIAAAAEAEKLYKKYEKEFLKIDSNSPTKNVENVDFDQLKNAQNVILFVNGHYSKILPGPSYGRKDYWLYFDDNTGRHINGYLNYFKFNKNNTYIIYVNGSSAIGSDQDFKDRFTNGRKFITLLLEKNKSILEKNIAIIGHSEGVAYSAGIIDELYRNNAKIKEAVYLSADEGAEDFSHTNSNVPTYQIEYMYFDTHKNKGCTDFYDWVIGTNYRYKTYSGIKGVTKFGIAIRNDLGESSVHGTTASISVIPYLEDLKKVSYQQNLNKEGKVFYSQIPKNTKRFWKIGSQFIDANHPQFDLEIGKKNYNLKCRK